MNPSALTAAMDRAVASGCLDPQLVSIDAGRDTSQVAAVARYDRPAPTRADYDQLLTGTRT